MSGFVAGTLVHTKEGLKPIEQIKVGDFVLSKPENGGKQEYKRVLRTFARPPERVIHVRYSIDENPNIVYRITATLNHPFWIDGEGWTAAENLKDCWSSTRNFELGDGSLAKLKGLQNIYVSDKPGIGWTPSHWGEIRKPGALWDFVNQELVANDVHVIDAIAFEEMADPYLKLPVYNIEVEDFHTYYVGKHGVWVHIA